MKFNSSSGYLALLALIQFLLMHGDCLYRSISIGDTTTINQCSWMHIWILIFCSINGFIMMMMIWSDLFHHYINDRHGPCNAFADRPSQKLSVNRTHLTPFESVQTYDLIHLSLSTTRAMFDETITQIRCTHKFTMTIKSNTLMYDKMSMYIEAIQSLRSLIVVIHYDHARDASTLYASNLRRIFSSIFQSGNLVQTWGNLRSLLSNFVIFDLFTDQQLTEVYSIDEERKFQEWHSELLRHKNDVDHNRDFTYRSHPCSCIRCQHARKNAHRWILSDAIALCFNEYLDADRFDFNQCLAITKLSNFVRNCSSHELFLSQF